MRGLGGIILCAAALFWTAPAQAQSAQAVVSATTQWQQTNTALRRGAKLQITAQGQWTTGASARGEMAGPDGLAGRGSRTALLSTANLGALIGKVGPNGAPFLIGSKYAGEAGGDGNLLLAINADAGAFGDNQGRLSVAVTATAPPANTAAVASARPRPSASLSIGGARIGPTATAPITTAPPVGVTGRTAPATTRPPATTGGGVDNNSGGGVTVRPQITIPLSAIFGRRPSTTPSTAPSATPSTKPPSRNPQTGGQVDVAVATPPGRLPPTRPPSSSPSTTPPTTTPPTRTPPTRPPSVRPPVTYAPPTRTPPTRPPQSVAPPVVLTEAPPRVEQIPSTAPPESVELASVAPPPLVAPQEPIVAELPPAPPPPAVTPPLIPANLVMPAAIAGGGAALLLLFLLFLPKPKPSGKRGGKGAQVAARVVNDGRSDQSLSVKWKGR
jgi:hypothetical protein